MQYKFEQPLVGNIGNEHYRCTINWRNGTIVADEPEPAGGKDSGPDPHSLLLSSIVSCTLITLRMYIDRKGWKIDSISVKSNMFVETVNETLITTIDQDIDFGTSATQEQAKRLLEIAKHCPISKILENKIQPRLFIKHNEDAEKTITYSNNEISVLWKPEFCQHSTRCWKQLPEVFDYNKKKWINPEGAPSDKIIEQVNRCPSGALSWKTNVK
ncbi:MAG TPA: (4Fe-4S)-binding protein [Bacteroidia bacterium]|nr:(4Fe-4S)-binding protein [Bacteroidia bacterium]